MAIALATSNVIRDAAFRDIARRIIQGQSRELVCLAHSINPRTLSRYLVDDDFRRVYVEVADTLYADVDSAIADEKAGVNLRRAALAQRAMTVLADVMAAAQEHIRVEREVKGNTHGIRATVLKAAVDASRAALEVDLGHQRLAKSDTSPSQHLTFNINSGAAHVARTTVEELGIDVSRIFDVEVVLPANANAKEPANGDNPASDDATRSDLAEAIDPTPAEDASPP